MAAKVAICDHSNIPLRYQGRSPPDHLRLTSSRVQMPLLRKQPACHFSSATSTVKVFVKREGAFGWVPVTVSTKDTFGLLMLEAVKQLQLTHPPDMISLFPTDEAGNVIGSAFNNTQRVTDALEYLGDPSVFIIVKLTGPWHDASKEDEVYAVLPACSKALIDAARKHRQRLKSVKALMALQRTMTRKKAEHAGISVLREDTSGKMTVGMFQVPVLDRSLVTAPRTFDDFVSSDPSMFGQTRTMLLFPQRLQLAFELLDAVKTGKPLGVHLSGSGGVGKSGVAFLAFLLCAARDLCAVYIPRAGSWVDAATTRDGGGLAVFLETFFKQNADIIIKHSKLRNVFEAAQMGKRDPFCYDVMDGLRDAMGHGMHAAVILDDVQHITKAVKEGKQARSYFEYNWYGWANDNDVFQRMSVASSQPNMKISDGEYHRLRTVEPLDPLDRDALQKSDKSPAYVADPADRERVVFLAGNVLRKLVDGASYPPKHRKPTNEEVQCMHQDLWNGMEAGCADWLASLSPAERQTAAHSMMPLVGGRAAWMSTDGLDDAGIMYRASRHETARPVSLAASAVLLRVLGNYEFLERKPLHPIAAWNVYGFPRLILASLDTLSNSHVGSKLLDGSHASALDLRCAYSLPFNTLDEVVLRDEAVLYRPVDAACPCHAILTPALGDADGAIRFIECGVTDPLTVERVGKLSTWFMPKTGVFTDLVARIGRRGCVVLFYPGVLPMRKQEDWSDTAKAITSVILPVATAPDQKDLNKAGFQIVDSSFDAAIAWTKATPENVAPNLQPDVGTAHTSSSLGIVVRVVDATSLPSMLISLRRTRKSFTRKSPVLNNRTGVARSRRNLLFRW